MALPPPQFATALPLFVIARSSSDEAISRLDPLLFLERHDHSEIATLRIRSARNDVGGLGRSGTSPDPTTGKARDTGPEILNNAEAGSGYAPRTFILSLEGAGQGEGDELSSRSGGVYPRQAGLGRSGTSPDPTTGKARDTGPEILNNAEAGSGYVPRTFILCLEGEGQGEGDELSSRSGGVYPRQAGLGRSGTSPDPTTGKARDTGPEILNNIGTGAHTSEDTLETLD